MIIEYLLSWFFSLPLFENFRLSLPSGVQLAFSALFDFLSFISPVCDLNTLIRAVTIVASTWVTLIFVKLILGTIGVLKP